MRHVTALLLVLMAAFAQAAFAQSEERVAYASVLDKDGAPVPNLTEKDFIVREDGQAREVLSVVPDNDPLQIALLVDTGRGMRNSISELRLAVAAFIDNARQGADIALITLGARPTIVVPYTPDRAALKKGIGRIFADPDSGNTLLDGIAEASQGIEKRKVGHAAIAAIGGSTDLSARHYEEVLKALRNSGAVLHVITLGTAQDNVDRELAVGKGTEETGGTHDTVLAAMGLPSKAGALAKAISSQYKIMFSRPPRLIPPKTTEVSVRNPDLRAHGILLKTDKDR